MATTSSSGQNRTTLSGRSLGSQKISPSGRIVSGCDFGEKKDPTHLGRVLSFDRKPSVRSFHLGNINPPTPAHIQHARRTKTKLRRSNAVRFGPVEYLKYIYHSFRMRMRLRRRSPVTFARGKSTRKRPYAVPRGVPSQSGGYQYHLRKRDVIKRKPSIKFRGISGPINVLQGAEALEAAERGKNQTFNIRTEPQLRQKTLPKRVSLPAENALNRASLVFPQPPEVGTPQRNHDYLAQHQPADDSDLEYDNLPDLVPPITTRRARERGSVLSTHTSHTHSHSHSDTLKNSNSNSTGTQHRLYQSDDHVDIEDALDFVSAWGAYLQKMVATRVIKERELREQEREQMVVEYDESDASSIFSDDQIGIYDSCTSECFAASDWVSSDDEMDPRPYTAPQALNRGYTISPGSLLTPTRNMAPPVPPHDSTVSLGGTLKHSPVRRPSGPRPMRTRHMSLGDQVPPLQLRLGSESVKRNQRNQRSQRSQPIPEHTEQTEQITPNEPTGIEVRQSLMRLQSSRARPLSTTFDFDTDSLSSQTRWVKAASQSSGSPRSRSAIGDVSAWSARSAISLD